MKWTKIGKIFDPTEHQLPSRCKEFAQSPQTLVLEDRVRVYFSTRERDAVGKFLSHVAFADFELDMRSLIGVSNRPVIELGELGCFDEHGIFPISIFKDSDKVFGYTTGWNRRVSVSADAAIGLVVSHDNGLSFKRMGKGPIMSANLNEPMIIADGFVRYFEGEYHMWYIFAAKWKKFSDTSAPDRIYKIAHATSVNGIVWQRNGRPIIADRLDEDECQALPTVIKVDGVYHMYFCYRAAFGFREHSSKAYRIGYAWSRDLKSWVRDDKLAGIDVSAEGWDSQMQCYPHVFECSGNVFMLYNGNEFGRHGFGLAVLQGK